MRFERSTSIRKEWRIRTICITTSSMKQTTLKTSIWLSILQRSQTQWERTKATTDRINLVKRVTIRSACNQRIDSVSISAPALTRLRLRLRPKRMEQATNQSSNNSNRIRLGKPTKAPRPFRRNKKWACRTRQAKKTRRRLSRRKSL